MNRTLTLEHETSSIVISTDKHDIFDQFYNWVCNKIQFNETEENHIEIENGNEFIITKLKAQKLGLLPIVIMKKV